MKAAYSGGAKVKYNDTKSMGSMAFGETCNAGSYLGGDSSSWVEVRRMEKVGRKQECGQHRSSPSS